jgi:hypothetical protein
MLSIPEAFCLSRSLSIFVTLLVNKFAGNGGEKRITIISQICFVKGYSTIDVHSNAV